MFFQNKKPKISSRRTEFLIWYHPIIDFLSFWTAIFIILNRDFINISDFRSQINVHHLVELTPSFRTVKKIIPQLVFWGADWLCLFRVIQIRKNPSQNPSYGYLKWRFLIRRNEYTAEVQFIKLGLGSGSKLLTRLKSFSSRKQLLWPIRGRKCNFLSAWQLYNWIITYNLVCSNDSQTKYCINIV